MPATLLSKDIDVLILEADAPRVLSLMVDLPGVQILNVYERDYVLHLYLANIQTGKPEPGLKLDFVKKLTWKGQPLLDTRHLLAAAVALPGAPFPLMVQDEAHDALTTFTFPYVTSSYLNDRYWPSVRAVLVDHRAFVATHLAPVIGQSMVDTITDRAAADDREALLAMVPAVRRAILFRNLGRSPIRAVVRVARHYLAELAIGLARPQFVTLSLLGPDGAGKSTILELLLRRFGHLFERTIVQHLKPTFFLKRRGETRGVVTDPHRLPARAWLSSAVKLVVWVGETWLATLWNIVAAPRCATLFVYDRYFDDVLVDPRRYRYGGPSWLARGLSRFVPRPTLFLVMRASADVIQARKAEVSPAETERQLQAYQQFAEARSDAAIIDTERPIDEAAALAEDAVIRRLDALARARIDAYLARRR